jgi:urease subunit alpha
MTTIDRAHYNSLYGPTAGDRFRLADTVLYGAIERDFLTHGDEAVFGGGKTIRDGMGQAPVTNREGALDLVIMNVIVMDPIMGIVKGDIGVREGRIVGVGKAGDLPMSWTAFRRASSSDRAPRSLRVSI